MKECRGEVLERVQKGLGSDQERAAFEAHLESCESCRMSFDLRADFDALGEAEPGDWERVAQMADAAVAAHRKDVPVRRRAPLLPWRLVVAAVVFSGVAAAGIAVQQATNSEAEDAQAGVTTPTPPETTKKQGTPLPAEPVTEEPEEREVSPEVEEPPVENTVVEAPSAGHQPRAASAQDAYRAANDARRAGKTTEAVQGYQKLQRNFPGSPEAHASKVSLGGLLLRSGSASAALTQFNAYLGSGGQLAPEAIFGRAQALRALGRSAEEVQNLELLVRQYPKSAYATHAQQRLQQLR